MITPPIHPTLVLADLTFRNRGSGISTQVLSPQVAYNPSKAFSTGMSA